MLFKAAIGILSVLGVNSVLKDNKDPKSKEEIKNNIRKNTDTISKYASAIYEVANEKLSNIQYETKDNNEEKEVDYFKNIKREDNHK